MGCKLSIRTTITLKVCVNSMVAQFQNNRLWLPIVVFITSCGEIHDFFHKFFFLFFFLLLLLLSLFDESFTTKITTQHNTTKPNSNKLNVTLFTYLLTLLTATYLLINPTNHTTLHSL